MTSFVNSYKNITKKTIVSIWFHESSVNVNVNVVNCNVILRYRFEDLHLVYCYTTECLFTILYFDCSFNESKVFIILICTFDNLDSQDRLQNNIFIGGRPTYPLYFFRISGRMNFRTIKQKSSNAKITQQ